MNHQKKFGVVYTPTSIVKMMLDKIPSFKNVSICDPSCGNGQFLVAIAERVCKKISLCRNEADKNIYCETLFKLVGIDIDEKALEECGRRLNRVLDKYEVKQISWRLYKSDIIDEYENIGNEGFDYVIGNPPYVRAQHLEQDRRDKIANGNWECVKGCSDLYILFFEFGFRLLKNGGKLVYVASNSWMKSDYGAPLRDLIKTKHNLKSIIDFGNYQAFKDVTSYTAIVEIDVWCNDDGKYTAWKCKGFSNDGDPKLIGCCLEMDENGWQILSEKDYQFVQFISERKIKLPDVADIHVGIQTLADDVFIFEKGNLDVEKEVTRRVIKASVMNNGVDKKDRLVIYPYENGNLISEKKLMSKYPKAYSYLLNRKDRLLRRDKGCISSNKWYGYGRDVSIVSGFGEKILTSGINRKPNFQKCLDTNVLFYSGYCIKPKENISFNNLLNELNSYEMEKFIEIYSKPFRNGWYSYAKSFIQNYLLTKNVYKTP